MFDSFHVSDLNAKLNQLLTSNTQNQSKLMFLSQTRVPNVTKYACPVFLRPIKYSDNWLYIRQIWRADTVSTVLAILRDISV